MVHAVPSDLDTAFVGRVGGALELPPGWATDLALLRYTGFSMEDYGDHLVVRTLGEFTTSGAGRQLASTIKWMAI